MGDVKKSHATAKCKKGYAKLKVLVKSKGGDAVAQASVQVKAAEKKDKCTLKTSAEGEVIFTVKAGSYVTSVSADGSAKRQAPRRPFKEGTKDGIALEADAEEEVTVELEPVKETVTAHVDAEVATVRCPPPPQQNDEGDQEPAPTVDPMPVEVYLTSDQTYSAYTGGGKLKVPDELEVYKDEACQEAVANDAPFTHDELSPAKEKNRLVLYVRGKEEGKFKLGLELDAPDPADASIELVAAEKELESKPVTVVEPKVEVEYLVVQLDRGLSKHVSKNEAARTDGTAVSLSLVHSTAGPNYSKGLILEPKPAGCVAAYADAELTKKVDLAKPIPSDLLNGSEPHKLYLTGLKKGRFELVARVEEATKAKDKDPNFLLGEPVTIKMAVVELQLDLHQQDATALAGIRVNPDVEDIDDYYTALKDKELPAQKKLTDQEKVKQGRLLHVQREGHHGRALVSIPQLTGDDWPEEGCDDYELVLNEENVSGALEVYDQEVDGAKLDFPVKLKVSDLLNAEKKVWVQGKTATDKALDARLDLGLDRPDAPPEHEPKRNGDWARLTVVQIEEVKLDYQAPKGEAAAWDEANERFAINLRKPSAKGRAITLSAKLSKPIAKVRVHFMLSPDANNRKAANWGVDLPTTGDVEGTAVTAWKWKDITWDVKRKDKEAPDHLLHLSAETDAKGVAKADLMLSQFGGDVFHPGAYIDQDPHLAKFFHGHPDLGQREPVLAQKTIQVWRKIFFQKVRVEGLNSPGLAPTVGQYERVKVEAVDVGDLVVSRAKVDKFKPRAIYPKYMIQVGGGNDDALVVGDKNKSQFFASFKQEKDKPNKIPVLVVDGQWDPHEDDTAGPINPPGIRANAFPVAVDVGAEVLSPPLQGGKLLVSGTWSAEDWDATAGAWVNYREGTLQDADIDIDPNRGDLEEIRVRLPAGVGAPSADTEVLLEDLVVKAAESFLGESFKKRILAVYDPNEADDFQNTVVHELGHAYAQVVEGDPAGGVAGIPAHPNQADEGSGNHCRHKSDKCVMFDSGPIVGSLNRYCDICHPYLLVQDMTTIQ